MQQREQNSSTSLRQFSVHTIGLTWLRVTTVDQANYVSQNEEEHG